MYALNRAAFNQVVLEALKNKEQLRDFLSHSKHMDFSQVVIIAKTIEDSLLEQNPNLDKAETRRFAEIICGAADRINHEAMLGTRELMDKEARLFRNTRRSVMLDERYDLTNELTQIHKSILRDWQEVEGKIAASSKDDEEKDPLKPIERRISFYNALANASRNTIDPLVQKDIEAHIIQKTVVLDDNQITDRHKQQLEELSRTSTK